MSHSINNVIDYGLIATLWINNTPPGLSEALGAISNPMDLQWSLRYQKLISHITTINGLDPNTQHILAQKQV